MTQEEQLEQQVSGLLRRLAQAEKRYKDAREIHDQCVAANKDLLCETYEKATGFLNQCETILDHFHAAETECAVQEKELAIKITELLENGKLKCAAFDQLFEALRDDDGSLFRSDD